MRTKRSVRNLETEKNSLVEEIKDLRASIEELTQRKADLRSQINETQDIELVERRKIIIDELLIDCDEDPDSKAFDDYFAQDDPFLHQIRKALLED